MQSSKRMWFRLAGVVASLSAGAAMSVGIAQAADSTGAGATFPYAVYTKWAEAYKAKTGNSVNYQGIGSSGGIKQIKARTVDFGATDAPLSEKELDEAGLEQFPAVMGGATIVFNLPGVSSGQLKLDGATAADIFRGAITKWNDPRIASLNPGLKLPDTAITIVHRSDGSGTTAVVTEYLALQSKAFADGVGVGKVGKWPSNAMGGKGNPGVAANVQKVAGAIGYVDFADAKKNNLNFAALRNKDGKFIVPTLKAFQAVASGANFKVKGMAPSLLDQAGADTWPIVTATYILMYAKQDKPERAKAVLDFFSWSLRNGQSMADELGFVPLPDSVVGLVEAEWKQGIRDGSGQPVWK